MRCKSLSFLRARKTQPTWKWELLPVRAIIHWQQRKKLIFLPSQKLFVPRGSSGVLAGDLRTNPVWATWTRGRGTGGICKYMFKPIDLTSALFSDLPLKWVLLLLNGSSLSHMVRRRRRWRRSGWTEQRAGTPCGLVIQQWVTYRFEKGVAQFVFRWGDS